MRKTVKANIKANIFDDPKEEANYNHMIDDVIFKTFDDVSENKIFKKALEGMKSNYSEIFHGAEKHMFFCPTSFNFDSRIAENETSVPGILEVIQSQLNSASTEDEKVNLKVILNHLRKLRPQLAEQEFVDSLACFFYQHRGIFLEKNIWTPPPPPLPP